MEDKLKWLFKLYDKDGNGEIDPDEMEDVFTKLCKVNNYAVYWTNIRYLVTGYH